MLHMMIAQHEAQSCPASHAQIRERYLPYMGRLEEIAQQHGVEVKGSWADMPGHVLYFIVDAPHAHAVSQFAMELHLMDWNTVVVRAVVPTGEATQRAGEREIP